MKLRLVFSFSILFLAAHALNASTPLPDPQLPPKQNASHANQNSNQGAAVLQASLTHWFSSKVPYSAPGKSVVRLYCPALTDLSHLVISNTEVVLVSKSEAQLDNPAPEPKDYWIRVDQFIIAENQATIHFRAKSADYPKWSGVTMKLKRTERGWSVVEFGGGM